MEPICKGHFRTDLFEKTVTFLMTILQAMFRIMNEHKSFRLEIKYDAEALNLHYEFFVPTDKCVSDDTNLVS